MACSEIMLGPLTYPNAGDSCWVCKNQDPPCSLWPSSFSPPWKACHFWDLGWEGGGGGEGGVITCATGEYAVIYSVFLLLRI